MEGGLTRVQGRPRQGWGFLTSATVQPLETRVCKCLGPEAGLLPVPQHGCCCDYYEYISWDENS